MSNSQKESSKKTSTYYQALPFDSAKLRSGQALLQATAAGSR